MTRLSTSSSTWNLASTKWVHPQWFTQGCDFKWAASSRQKKTRENRNWKPTLYSHYEWPPGRAAEPQPAPQPQPRAGQARDRQCECPMLRSMPLTVANFLLLWPRCHSDYYPIYMQRRRLFSAASWISFFKHFLISLCASAFGSYSVSIPSALCLSVTSTSTDPQTEPDTDEDGDCGR